MDGTRSALVGGLLGLGLAAALLGMDADRDTLLAQGLAQLLREQRETDGGVFAALARAAPVSGAQSGDTPVDGAQVAGARVALHVDLDGASAGPGPFQRAFQTQLSLWSTREDRPAAEPDLFLADPGGAADLTVHLDLVAHEPEEPLTLETRVGSAADGAVPALVPAAARSWRPPGPTSLLPPLLAIASALVLRRTLLPLFLGILSGAVLMAAARDGSGPFASLLPGLLDVFTVYLRGELLGTFRIEVIGFVVVLVAMVGVMSRSGGVAGLVGLLLRFARTVRSTLLATFGMGLLIFFDDYANCVLVGNTMRPLTDRLRISREKLAWVVDSTAAPVAGISVLSTWIAFEVSTFASHLPAAGITESPYAVFLRTLPFRYYCLFTLGFVALSILLGRDLGPMAAAEERARRTGQLVRPGGVPMVSDRATRIEPRPGLPLRWFDAALPLLLVMASTLLWIFHDGGGFRLLADDPAALLTLSGLTGLLNEGAGSQPIFHGAWAGLLLAVFLAGSSRTRLGVVGGVVSAWIGNGPAGAWLAQRFDPAGLLAPLVPLLAYGATFAAGAATLATLAGLRGSPCARTRRPHLPADDIRRASLASVGALSFAVLILLQAWMIGTVCADLRTADYLVALLSGSVTPTWLPVLLFGAACVISFATGSSWSTMSLLLPNVVGLAASVGVAAGLGALPMVVLCIGAVLEGSIFGDHCSPISDTTVLSSVSSASDHLDHTRTQMPYAVIAALVAILVGYLPTMAVPWWSWPQALPAGLLTLALVLLVLGRRTPPGAQVVAPAHAG